MHDTILKSKVFLDHIAIESTNPKKVLDGEIDEFLEQSLYQI